MLRWFPRLQLTTACSSCSPPDLNFLDPYFIFMHMHFNHCHRCTASDLTSTLTGTAGDVLSDVPVISLVCSSPNVALNLDISAELYCLMSWISHETAPNLLPTYYLDLLISRFKLSFVTPICSLCSLILASNELEAAVISCLCRSVSVLAWTTRAFILSFMHSRTLSMVLFKLVI